MAQQIKSCNVLFRTPRGNKNVKRSPTTAIYRQKLGLACNVVLQKQVFFSSDDYRLEFRETPNIYYTADFALVMGCAAERSTALKIRVYIPFLFLFLIFGPETKMGNQPRDLWKSWPSR